MYQYPGGISTVQMGMSYGEPAYRRYDENGFPLHEEDIPAKPEDRSLTDKWFFVAFVLGIVILMPFLIYTLVYSDINRWQTTLFDYSSENFTIEPYDSYLHHRVDTSDMAWRMALACCTPLVLCLILAVMLRKATAFMVWFILVISWFYFLILAIALWVLVPEAIGAAIVMTIVTVVLLLVFVFLRNQVRLTIRLFKEAATAVFDMRAIFSIPVGAIFLMVAIAALLGTTTIFMATSRVRDSNGFLVFSDVMLGAVIFNIIMAYWAIEFIFGVQYMMVSGAVTKWFFTRNKTVLIDPVYTSFLVTLRYHLGTIALGSLIITLLNILRAVIRAFLNSRSRALAECCLRPIENLLRFFTKNMYIVTAMHGTAFCKSGRQAVRLLTLNICNTVSITSLADFVIGMSYVFVTGVSVAINYALFRSVDDYYGTYTFLSYYAAVAASLICCFSILGTFETAFSTAFLCVCQDFVLNNGRDKPYAMTKNMMIFLDDSKKVFQSTISKKGLPTV